MKLNKEQLQALKNYIEAVIEAKTDDGQSSDEGLSSSVWKSKCESELDKQFLE